MEVTPHYNSSPFCVMTRTFCCLLFLTLVSLSLGCFAANDSRQANSYDDDWQAKWVAHCKRVYRTAGKTPGFVLHIGDWVSRMHQYSQWPKRGRGKTSADVEVHEWCRAIPWGKTAEPDIVSKNGWMLATASVSSTRSFTATSWQADTTHWLTGITRDGASMPAVSAPWLARSLLLDSSTYPSNLQIDTVCSAFEDAQFAVLSIGNNDIRNEISTDNFLKNLTALVERIEASNIVVILMMLQPRIDVHLNDRVNSFNAVIRDYAKAHGLPLIDFHSEILRRRPENTWQNTLISPDGLTPTMTATGGDGTRYDCASDPYFNGGDASKHITGEACNLVGFLLRSWLSTQKLKEVKLLVVNRTKSELDADIKRLGMAYFQAAAAERSTLLMPFVDSITQTPNYIEDLRRLESSLMDADPNIKLNGFNLLSKVFRFNRSDRHNAVRLQKKIVESPDIAVHAKATAECQIAEWLMEEGNWNNASGHFLSVLKSHQLSPVETDYIRTQAARCLMQSRSYVEAANLYLKSAQQPTGARQGASRALSAARAFMLAGLFDQARTTLEGHILVTDADLCARMKIFSAELCLHEGKLEEAIASARCAYALAPTPTILEEATRSIAQILRAMDRTCVRANAFLQYQKHGAVGEDKILGTADDLANPLSLLKPLELKLIDAVVSEGSNDIRDKRAHTFALILAGREEDAMIHSRELLLTVESDPDNTAGMVNDLAVAMKAKHGVPVTLQVLADYLKLFKGPVQQSRLDQILERLEGPFRPAIRAGCFNVPEPFALKVAADEGKNFAAFIDQTLSTQILAHARNLEQAGQIDAARHVYLDMIVTLPNTIPETLERLLKSFSGELGQTKLTAAAAVAFLKYMTTNGKRADLKGQSEMLVTKVFLQEENFELALKHAKEMQKPESEAGVSLQGQLIEGLIYSQTDRIPEALKIFEKVAERRGVDDAVCQKAIFMIGWARLFNQEEPAARAAFERLIKEFPDSEHSKKAQELLDRINNGN
jgi:tetratricopeptide (TPR) repeat protein/lysophospholipase L1-like esterase